MSQTNSSIVKIGEIPKLDGFTAVIPVYTDGSTIYYERSDILTFIRAGILIWNHSSSFSAISDYIPLITMEKLRDVISARGINHTDKARVDLLPFIAAIADNIYTAYKHNNKMPVEAGISNVNASVKATPTPQEHELKLIGRLFDTKSPIAVFMDSNIPQELFYSYVNLCDAIKWFGGSPDNALGGLAVKCKYENAVITAMSATNLAIFLRGNQTILKTIAQESYQLVHMVTPKVLSDQQTSENVHSDLIAKITTLIERAEKLENVNSDLIKRIEKLESDNVVDRVKKLEMDTTPKKVSIDLVGNISFDVISGTHGISVYVDSDKKAYHNANDVRQILAEYSKWVNYSAIFEKNVFKANSDMGPRDVILGDNLGDIFRKMFGSTTKLIEKTNGLVISKKDAQ